MKKTTTFNYAGSSRITVAKIVRQNKEVKLTFDNTPFTILERDVTVSGGIIDNWATKMNREITKGDGVVILALTRRTDKKLISAFTKRYPWLSQYISIGWIGLYSKLKTLSQSNTTTYLPFN